MADYPQTSFSSSAPVALPDMTAQQDAASLGVQIQGLLSHNAQLDAAIQKVLPQAVTPTTVGGQSTAKLPGKLKFPTFGQPQFAAPAGHRDARNQGIAKTVAGAANLVGSILNAKKKEKQDDLAHDITRVLGAQDSMSQSQQILKGDPNNADAKASLQKSKDMINSIIGADPKKLKQFEKAFNINFVDPSANEGPEHDARKQAVKDYAQQLADKTPDKQVPNAAAQAQVQILSAQKAANDAQLKAITPIYQQQQKDAAALDRVALQQQEADRRNQNTQDNANQRAQLRSDTMMKDAILRSETAFKTTGMREAGANARLLRNIQAKSELADKVRGTDAERASKLDNAAAAQMNKAMDQQAQIIANNENLKAQALKADKKADVSKYDTAINNAKELQKTGQVWMQNFTNRSNARAGGGLLDPQGKGAAPANDSSNGKPATSDNNAALVKHLLGEDEDDSSDSSDDDTDPDNF